MIPPIKLQTDREIGYGHPAYIIAEVGSNHDGSFEKAKQMIDLAKDVGADAVKFQSFQVDKLINSQHLTNGRWEPHPAWDTLANLTVPKEWHAELQKYATKIGIDFLSTPFDLERLQLLLDLNIPVIKIASGDLTYHEMLMEVGKSQKPVFLSTGGATIEEIDAALKVLFGHGTPHLVLLHCVSQYPAQYHDANLRALVTLLKEFNHLIGFSDHTPRSIASLGAIALGACVIEKHLTDDKTLPGPDHHFAMDREEFSQMVAQIRQMESALGDGCKVPVYGEIEERILARRAVYAAEDIQEGSVISRPRVKVVRHAYPEGIGAAELESVLGKTARCDIQKDQLINWEML